MINAEKNKRLVGIQYLRAIAALMVAFAHIPQQIPIYAPRLTFPHFNRFTYGVDIFFIISGFIMVVTSRSIRPLEFMRRRIIRIVPLYWLLTLVMVALALIAPSLFRTTVVTPMYVLKSLLFIPYPNPGQHGAMEPLLVPGWTLDYEMFFYAIFAAVLVAPERYRLAINGAVLLLFIAVASVAGPSFEVLKYLGSPRILEFWLGCLLGTLHNHRALRVPAPVAAGCVLFGFAALFANPEIPGWANWILMMAPPFAIVFGAAALEQSGGVRALKFPLLLGDASFSTYLTHIFTLGFLRVVWVQLGLDRGTYFEPAAFVLASYALIILVAVLVYAGLEQPMLRILSGTAKKRSGPVSDQSGSKAVS